MCGLGDIDTTDWRKHTNYRGEFHDKHIVIQWFWKVIIMSYYYQPLMVYTNIMYHHYREALIDYKHDRHHQSCLTYCHHSH